MLFEAVLNKLLLVHSFFLAKNSLCNRLTHRKLFPFMASLIKHPPERFRRAAAIATRTYLASVLITPWRLSANTPQA